MAEHGYKAFSSRALTFFSQFRYGVQHCGVMTTLLDTLFSWLPCLGRVYGLYTDAPTANTRIDITAPHNSQDTAGDTHLDFWQFSQSTSRATHHRNVNMTERFCHTLFSQPLTFWILI